MFRRCLLIVSLTIFILSLVSANAGDVLFETIMPWQYWWSDILWGNNSFTYVKYFAATYRPTVDQEVCTIKVGMYKSGNPTDSIVMTIRERGTNFPLSGQVIRTSIISGNQVASRSLVPANAAFTSFSIFPCLNLSANTYYSFVFERTQPDPNNYYFYQRSNLISYSQTASWAYVPINGFWQEAVNFEPALRLEGPEPQGKEPVIIVPGILGSRLNRVSDGEEVWPNMGKMGLSMLDDYLNDLKLNESGNEILDVNSAEIIENVLSINQYGNLIQKFKDNGYQLGEDLFVFPYDWRLDTEVASIEIGTVIDQAVSNSPTGKVNIIAHSMGGIVVKDYLSDNGDSVVNKLIFAGTPHLGSPKAFNALNWGDDFDLKFLFLGLNKNKAKEIAQNMPAVYELLPSREYINQAGPYVQNFDYDQTSQFMTSDPLLSDYRNNNLLNTADQFHQNHDSWLPQSVNVYSLMGCREYDTIGSFEISNDGSVDIRSTNGDGTVPLVSASQVPGNDYFVSYPMTKINHTGLVSDNGMIDLIYDFISSDEEPTLPSGIYKTSAECDEVIDQIKRLRFSTHSPVNLHVYDNLGNHTGLTPEGNIEINIPDSNFLQVGDNTFIFVPDGVEYSVNIDAYATGSFDFKVKELNNGQVENSLAYNDIPINNPELKANFEFANIASSSPLGIDENGDGEVDSGYTPSGERILYKGIDNLIADIKMAYELGWIFKKSDFGLYMKKINRMIKVEKRIKKLEEKLPNKPRVTKRIEKLIKKIDRVLANQLLKDLEKDYNKGRINGKAYNLIKKDILWLLEN